MENIKLSDASGNATYAAIAEGNIAVLNRLYPDRVRMELTCRDEAWLCRRWCMAMQPCISRHMVHSHTVHTSAAMHVACSCSSASLIIRSAPTCVLTVLQLLLLQGLLPYFIHPSNGRLMNDHITFGAMGDSYYEYLLKARRFTTFSLTWTM